MADGVNILSGLNSAQREAVTSDAAVLQVLAPPGSGKTKTLTARVAYLLAHRRLKPWNIIVCTFTVKAANEMKERITLFVGEEQAKQLKLGTFHSVALRYLKQHGQHIGLPKDFGIADTSDSKAIVKRIIKQNKFTIEAPQARSRISAQKAKGIDSEQFARSCKKAEQQEFTQIYSEYEATLKASNLLDYDDLLLRCCFLLQTQPQCVANVEALLIDEFQDTNTIQYDLMGLFAQARNNITIVGDPDQSIYGFRSAEIKNLGRMKEKWSETLTINLKENYRSSGAILKAAQHIIEQDESRPPKKLQATHLFGLRPVLRKLPSAAAEADWLVSEVKRLQALTGKLLQPTDFAVLLRSSALSRVIETAMGREGIPYRMIGGTRFYDRVEVKLLVDYLRVVSSPGNSEAVERIINTPLRRVGNATVQALHKEARSRGMGLWQLVLGVVRGHCKTSMDLTKAASKGLEQFVDVILCTRAKMESPGATVIDVMNTLLKKLKYQEHLKKTYPDDHEARWTNAEELITQATDASDPNRLRAMLEEMAMPEMDDLEQPTNPSVEDGLLVFLANIALTSSTEQKADEEGGNQQLTISTIHAAKGLEWPVVFIPACFDGSIPHSRADDHDEERRLLYVGMTRAQACLYLSSPQRNSQREEACMSTFLVQPGVSSFFEEHGPSISVATARSLATTLRRACPTDDVIAASTSLLERDEDNYWPLTGEEPPEEMAKRDAGTGNLASGSTRPLPWFSSASTMNQQGFSTASATLKPGFVSVSDRYVELMEQSAIRKVDKRAEEKSAPALGKTKGRKRQIEGQGSISSFFKRPQVDEGAGRSVFYPSTLQFDTSLHTQTSEAPSKSLREIQNPGFRSAVTSTDAQRALFSHKPKTAPLLSRPNARPAQTIPADKGFVFLSSSPPQPEDENHATSDTIPTSDAVHDEQVAGPASRPAATFHTTTMQSLPPQRRTLGMRRSLHGWNARDGRRLP